MSDDQVRLKPFLGIAPGVYLAFIYGTVLLVILFFIFLYPGLKNPGSIIVVKSEPWGAAILVDGVYMDAAPAEVFVNRGSRQIELRLPGFQPVQIEKDIRGRLFASAFFPTKIDIHQELQVSYPIEAFLNEAAEYAAWSFAGEPGAGYQIPLSLSEGAYRLGPAASDPAVRTSMEDTVVAATRFAVTRAGLRDLIRAKTLLDNQGLSPSPLSLLDSAGDIIGFLGENPMAALWLADVLNDDARSALAASDWYLQAAGLGAERAPMVQSGAIIQAGLLNFRMIGGGLPLLGGNFSPGTVVDTFYISETVISARAWEAFLEDQPRWRKGNLQALMAEGLVREEYLEIIPGAPAEGVSGISWHAAVAFCEWLNNRVPLPPQFSSWEFRLPTEQEWEYAAKSGIPLSGDLGNFWEWCADPFAPLSFLSAPPGAITALGSPERVLRGGSWASPPGAVGNEVRASLPPSFSSPFLSFRPVIAPQRQLP